MSHIKVKGQGHMGFLYVSCVHDTAWTSCPRLTECHSLDGATLLLPMAAATHEQYLALSKAWRSCWLIDWLIFYLIHWLVDWLVDHPGQRKAFARWRYVITASGRGCTCPRAVLSLEQGLMILFIDWLVDHPGQRSRREHRKRWRSRKTWRMISAASSTSGRAATPATWAGWPSRSASRRSSSRFLATSSRWWGCTSSRRTSSSSPTSSWSLSYTRDHGANPRRLVGVKISPVKVPRPGPLVRRNRQWNSSSCGRTEARWPLGASRSASTRPISTPSSASYWRFHSTARTTRASSTSGSASGRTPTRRGWPRRLPRKSTESHTGVCSSGSCSSSCSSILCAVVDRTAVWSGCCMRVSCWRRRTSITSTGRLSTTTLTRRFRSFDVRWTRFRRCRSGCQSAGSTSITVHLLLALAH